jgi:hypothetical protein
MGIMNDNLTALKKEIYLLISEASVTNSFELPSVLLQTLEKVAQNAFVDKQESSLKFAHQLLNELLKYDFYIPKPSQNIGIDRSAALFAIKQMFVRYFLESLYCELDESNLFIKGNFADWWKSEISKYEDCPHLLFEYLSEKGSLQDLKEFIRHDASVHVAFSDLLALMQVGTRAAVKCEFFKNFSDEVGCGEDTGDHLEMFKQTLDSLALETLPTADIYWQALACANLLMIVSCYRSLYYVGIGYIGCLEALTAGRFKHITLAGQKNGLNKKMLRFYTEHSECDGGHAEAWLNRVIIPTIEQFPDSVADISRGLLYRLSVSNVFWNKIYQKLSK